MATKFKSLRAALAVLNDDSLNADPLKKWQALAFILEEIVLQDYDLDHEPEPEADEPTEQKPSWWKRFLGL